MSKPTDTPEPNAAANAKTRELVKRLIPDEHASTVRYHPSTTIRPTLSGPDSAGERAIDALAAVPSELAEGALDFMEVIGEGGMAIVSLAAQRSVGRHVAIKALRPEQRSPQAVVRLLREAWVTAALEHPNVPPVHDVALDREMGPIIVLKRIEGEGWRDVMHDAEAVLERFHADDLLEFNIDILMQLCRAVHFAHSRGILHRDIKPSNVMIGSFGEVYLLDWGIAVSLRDSADGRFPLAAHARGLAGTPCYMSPEMLDPNYAPLSAQTDIYLLGAALYEVVMGRPPHVAADPAELLCSIIESKPLFDDRVPDELQSIATRAMDPLPTQRFESAEEMRLALALFLKHRQAARLTSEARSRLANLAALLEAPDVARDRVYKLFGECRFGLQEARRGWPDNDETRRLMDELLTKTIDYELKSDNASAALTLLGEIEDAPAELRARVDEAVAAQQHKRAELERLQRDLDPRIGRRTRRAVSVGMGIVWTLAPLLTNVVEPVYKPTVVTLVLPALLLLLATGLWIGARESLSKTAINRRVMVAILVGFCAHMVHVLATQLAGLPPRSELAMGMVTFGAITAILAHTAESQLWPVVPLYWLGALAAALWRTESAWVLSGCNLLLTIYLFAIWRPERTATDQSP